MSKFSNTNELNDMIDKFVHKYETIFRDVIRNPNMFKNILKDDIQKLVDEAKNEVRESCQNYVADKDSDAKMINEDMEIWRSAQEYR